MKPRLRIQISDLVLVVKSRRVAFIRLGLGLVCLGGRLVQSRVVLVRFGCWLCCCLVRRFHDLGMGVCVAIRARVSRHRARQIRTLLRNCSVPESLGIEPDFVSGGDSASLWVDEVESLAWSCASCEHDACVAVV